MRCNFFLLIVFEPEVSIEPIEILFSTLFWSWFYTYWKMVLIGVTGDSFGKSFTHSLPSFFWFHINETQIEVFLLFTIFRRWSMLNIEIGSFMISVPVLTDGLHHLIVRFRVTFCDELCEGFHSR